MTAPDSPLDRALTTTGRPDAGAWVARAGDAFRLEAGPASLLEPKAPGSSASWPAGYLRAAEVETTSIATDGSRTVLFDGLLYNRTEIAERAGDALPPETNPAALILQAYCRGADVLHRVKGIFALLIADDTQGLTLCARDPMGVWPLYYTESRGDLLFSRSIDALLGRPGVSPAIDRATVANHLRHVWPQPDETYFSAIKRLPPGHALRVSGGIRTVFRYWDPVPDPRSPDWVQPGEIGRFEALFHEAVARCLAQGPTCIFLSGGIDSVSVAAVASDLARSGGLPVPAALSLLFPTEATDEESVQRGVAEGLELEQIALPFWEAVGERGLVAAALALSPCLSVPLFNFWQPAYDALAQRGKGLGRSIVLTGTGGDEWLGVTPYYASDLLLRLDLAGLYRLWRAAARSNRASPSPYRSSLRLFGTTVWRFGLRDLLGATVRTALLNRLPHVYHQRWQRSLDRSTPVWLTPDAALRGEMDARAAVHMPGPGIRDRYHREIRQGLDHALVAMEMEETFQHGRRLGMRFLAPYLDADLVHFLRRVPPELLQSSGLSKSLARGMLARQFPGLGFERQRKVIASDFWRSILAAEAPAVWRELGGVRRLIEWGLVDAVELDRFRDGVIASRRWPHLHRVWDLLTLECWIRSRA